jgi:hypothetical protein
MKHAPHNKPDHKLTPAEVRAMSDKEFKRRFGFVPVDALERTFFAATGKRPTPLDRAVIASGALD